MEVGRLCMKLAGREAGEKCVVVDEVDECYVLISGPGVKRRRCNIAHLEPLDQVVKLRKGASDNAVEQAFAAIGEAVPEKKFKRKPKPSGKPKEKAKPEKKLKEKPKPPEKAEKPAKKKEEKPAEEPKAEG